MPIRKLLAFVAAFTLLAAFAIVAHAEQERVVRRIGFLRIGELPINQSFWDALRELSWIEGKNVRLEPRYATSAAQFPVLAAELVSLKVDVILTNGTPATRAARKATSTIPIVFFLAADPVKNGVVQSLARPGVNATGFAYGVYEHKMLEVLNDAIPGLTSVAYPVFEDEAFGSDTEFLRTAKALGLRMQAIPMRAPEEIGAFYAAARSAGVQAVLIPDIPRLVPHVKLIGEKSVEARLPAIAFARGFADAGGLLYYGPAAQHWPRLAYQIDKILRGANPAQLPVEQASTFELVVNTKTASALGIAIPKTLLLRAQTIP